MASKKGFTLVEVMVSVSIFVILLTVFAGFFVGAIQAQRKALASQELIDNISYNLEYMSRSIRMAKKDIEGTCITAKNNYQLTQGGKGLKFVNYDDVCQEFFWDEADGRLYEKKGEETALPLTPLHLRVTSFQIEGEDSWGQEESLQPKVTLYIEIETKEEKPEAQHSIAIQTTISQRNLNVKY